MDRNRSEYMRDSSAWTEGGNAEEDADIGRWSVVLNKPVATSSSSDQPQKRNSITNCRVSAVKLQQRGDLPHTDMNPGGSGALWRATLHALQKFRAKVLIEPKAAVLITTTLLQLINQLVLSHTLHATKQQLRRRKIQQKQLLLVPLIIIIIDTKKQLVTGFYQQQCQSRSCYSWIISAHASEIMLYSFTVFTLTFSNCPLE